MIRQYALSPARRFAVAAIAAAVLSGCAVTPPAPLDENVLRTQADADQQAMYRDQEPLRGPVTLEEAIARAVKYNLRQRLALMERALEDDLVDVQEQGMLPKLSTRAGLRTRSNDYGSSSESLATGVQSLVPSTSQERSGASADLQLTWNVLDFGLSYFGAKAQGNKALAAEERRRRVVADIIRETRAAYWNAVTAERLTERVASTLADARETLDYARQTEQKRLVAPITALRYQRDLLGLTRQMEALDHEMAQAKVRLATLMNLPLGTTFRLVVPDGEALEAPALRQSLPELEAIAMVRRPELREEGYLARNAVLETRMSMLRLLPNAALFGGLNHDTNKYLANRNWADAGVQVSWNLLNVLNWPAIERSGKTREQVGELRRQALRMTVLSQVHVAWLERARAEAAFQRAQELNRLQSAIQGHAENAARSKAETRLELVRVRVETLLATRARDLSYAELVNAQNTIYQAAGIDPLPAQVADLSIDGLARAITAATAASEAQALDVPALPAAEAVVLATTAPSHVPASEPVRQAAAALAVSAQPPMLRRVAGDPWRSFGSLAASNAAVVER